MNANEAPKKIYCGNNGHGNLSYSNQLFPNAVEYVRADAFIEKACEWMKENITNNPECNRIISKKGVITMGELIKDFRKYMEGE